MSALQAFRSVGPWSLVLTLAMASGARTEPTEIAALPAGEPTTKVATHQMLDELDCLAMNVYWEARSEPNVGQKAVAAVTLNRVAHPAFPDTICEVVTQGQNGPRHRCQFSWFCDGRDDTPRESLAWQRARLIADLVLTGRVADPTGGALWYHTDQARPAWTGRLAKSRQIGRHLFYRETTDRSRLADADAPDPGWLALSRKASENGPMRRTVGHQAMLGTSVISVSYAYRAGEHGFERSQFADAVVKTRDDARTDMRLNRIATERWQKTSPLLEPIGKAPSRPCAVKPYFKQILRNSLLAGAGAGRHILNAAFADGAPRWSLMRPLSAPCPVVPTCLRGVTRSLCLQPIWGEHHELLSTGSRPHWAESWVAPTPALRFTGGS
jgi:N-acetylmuramoyl-L-alanine amidase